MLYIENSPFHKSSHPYPHIFDSRTPSSPFTSSPWRPRAAPSCARSWPRSRTTATTSSGTSPEPPATSLAHCSTCSTSPLAVLSLGRQRQICSTVCRKLGLTPATTLLRYVRYMSYINHTYIIQYIFPNVKRSSIVSTCGMILVCCSS